MRGLKTLTLRMRQHSESALKVAQMLRAHRAVKRVRYPFLEDGDDLTLARAQMSHGGGMLSFELQAGPDDAIRMIDRLKLISRAISLGDTESLITHPGSLLLARQKVDPHARLRGGVTMDLVRLALGLEDADDVIADLQQALDSL
eukprot:gene16275-22055_t